MTTADAAIIDAHRLSRDRAAALTGRTAIAGRIVGVALRLVTVPLCLRALGPERYGAWIAVSSLLSWLALFDFGVGYALVNPLSDAYARGDRRRMRELVASSIAICGLIALLAAASVVLIVFRLDVGAVLGVGRNLTLSAELRVIALAAGALSACSFLFNYLPPLCLGLQAGYLGNLNSIAGAVLSAGLTILAAVARPSILAFVLAAALPALLLNLLLSTYLFVMRDPDLRPRPGSVRMGALKSLTGFAVPLLIIQATTLVVLQAANVLIANRFGPAAVPRYSVPFALFSTGSSLCYALVSAYWPAYAESIARGDVVWIRQAVSRTLTHTLPFMAVACIGAALFGRPVVRLWAGEAAVPGELLMVSMAAYFFLVVLSMNYSTLLMGIGALRAQAALSVVVAVTHLAGFFALAPMLGMASIPIAGGAGVLFNALAARAIVYRRILQMRTSSAPVAP
ncbi:MAG: hypothetical protein ABSD56_02280 [Bryobacteraceae bacterium]